MYPYGYGYYFDPTYILIIIGVIITMIASSKMNSTFRRYSRVRCHCGLTGSQAAERILNQAGIYDVSVERVSGNLTDHYDPKNKVLRLSDATYGSDSIAAIGVAASARICTIEDPWGYGSSCESWFQSFLVVYSRWSDPWNESDIIECWNFIIFISGDLSISNTSGGI